MQIQPEADIYTGLQITSSDSAKSYMKDLKARLDVTYDLRGNATYSIELSHNGLKKHRIIKGKDRNFVARKAEVQANDWLKQFETQSSKTDADIRTAEAEAYLAQLDQILKHTLIVNDAINWEKLKDSDKYHEPYPVKPVPIQDTSRPLIPTPVPPIVRMDRADSRFVAAYDVIDTLEDTTNLAAIDWEDFEHLIREVFEKEFSGEGAEVKVTRASRDGGVDAVAFDPDPIRGGKIVIQAKRYTNTVGVAAVRDLYGTVMNEGAIKGILVTTSDYGPDAYSFANGKPLTLLNGSNLLHLLQKHGHRATIDITAAKKQRQ